MAIAEVVLRIRDESSKTLSQLTATSEGYDATLKRVADDVAKEEAAEKSRAAALGLTVQQLRQVDSALQSQITTETQLGEVNWQTAQGAQSLKKNLGDIVQSLIAGQSPMQVFMQQSEGVVSALTAGESPAAVLKQTFGGMFSTIAANAASLGTLIAALGVAAVAYRVYSAEADRINEGRKFQKELAESLRDSELTLRDALVDQRVAVGQLSEVEGKLLDIRHATQDAVRDYVAKAEERIAALQDEIEANREYVTIQHGVAAALAVVATASSGETARRLASGESIQAVFADNARAINSALDAITGLESGIDDAKGKIHALNEAEGQAATNFQAARKATEAAAVATNAHKEATKAATAAEKERADILKRMKEAIESFQKAQNFLYQQAIANDPIAQENARYADLVAQINAAAKATGDLTTARLALNAAEAEHLRLLAAAMAPTGPNAADVAASQAYDQGLGMPSAPPPAPTQGGGITYQQGLAAAGSLSDLVKLDPTGIASGVYAGMKAAIDLGKGGGALGDLNTLIVDLGNALPGLAAGIGDLVSNIFTDAIPSLLSGISSFLKTAPTDLINGLTEGIPDLIGAIASEAPTIALEIATFMPRVGAALIAAVLSPSTWVDAGKMLVDGFMSGVSEMFGDIGGILTDVFSGFNAAVEFLVRGAGSLYDGIVSLFSADTWVSIGEGIAQALADLFASIFGSADQPGAFDKGGWFDTAGKDIGSWFSQAGKDVRTWFDQGLVGSYDVGTDYISRSGLAMVHEGEAVVPAHGATQAAILGRASSGGGATYVLNGVIASNVEELVRTLREAERQGVSIG